MLLPNLVWVIVAPPLMALVCHRISTGDDWRLTWAATGGLLAVIYLMIPGPLPLTAAVNAVVGLVLWWWNRRKPLRALRAFGYKARAKVTGLVRKAREAASPRPVLRPVPGGAR